MEKVGFVLLLDRLLDQGLTISTVSTEHHMQIRKLMRANPKYEQIVHTIDPWHLIKGKRSVQFLDPRFSQSVMFKGTQKKPRVHTNWRKCFDESHFWSSFSQTIDEK